MKQYRICIAYDGTDFCGWAQQVGKRSVIETLAETFLKTFHVPISLLGASRTDAGVHAMGQVAVFKTSISVDPATMRWAWNNALPPSILIRSLVQDNSFNPHQNVKHKIYYYHLTTKRPLPFAARYVHFYATKFDEQVLRDALALFVGTHDFNAFYTGTDRGTNTVRTIHAITLEYYARFGAYRISVVGERFLRHMVRRMIGAALAVVAGRKTHDDIVRALQTRETVFDFPVAPAQGLLLYHITYGETHG